MNGTKHAFRFLACVALVMSGFAACTSNDDSQTIAPSGPPSVAITGISLGQGGDSSVLSCDYTIGVTLRADNWTLQPHDYCNEPQCGQVRVSLLREDGAVLASKEAATNGIDLDLKRLLDDVSTLQSGTYAILAELIGNDDKPFVISDAGNSTAQTSFTLTLPCADPAGGGGGSGVAGGSGIAGGSGTAGASGASGSAGAAGDGAAGDGAGGVAGASVAAGAAGL